MKNILIKNYLILYEILRYQNYLSNQTGDLLIIIFLFKENIINRDKYVSMLHSFFKSETDIDNTLVFTEWHKNIYHCTILHEYFNDVGRYDYFNELSFHLKYHIGQYQNQSHITFEDLFDAIKIITNKKDSIIIKIMYNILNQFISCSISNDMLDDFVKGVLIPMFGYSKIDIIPYRDFEPIGYCCEDCDGDYKNYKYYQYQDKVTITTKNHYKDVLSKIQIIMPNK